MYPKVSKVEGKKMKRYTLLIVESESITLYDSFTNDTLELKWSDVDIKVVLSEDLISDEQPELPFEED